MTMISIITPILNERENIRPFFEHLNTLEGDFELILVDGGSTDDTISEVNKYRKLFNKQLTLLKTTKGRGKQMNKGAESAKGDIFLFLHIDCIIEKDSIITIEKEIENEGLIGGGMIQSFSNSDFLLNLISSFGNFRTQVTRIFFGDFGIFVKKEIFEKIGGYDEIIYLEDLEFSKKLKKFGKLKQIDKKLVTSPRRFLSFGKLKITVIFILSLLTNTFGIRPKFLIKYIADK
jgi:rSAM/selenodomain-associated transferase 2